MNPFSLAFEMRALICMRDVTLLYIANPDQYYILNSSYIKAMLWAIMWSNMRDREIEVNKNELA